MGLCAIFACVLNRRYFLLDLFTGDQTKSKRNQRKILPQTQNVALNLSNNLTETMSRPENTTVAKCTFLLVPPPSHTYLHSSGCPKKQLTFGREWGRYDSRLIKRVHKGKEIRIPYSFIYHSIHPSVLNLFIRLFLEPSCPLSVSE